MSKLSEEQRAAIERIDSDPDETPTKDRLKLMKGALSVSRQEVEASLAKKEEGKKSKRGRPPKHDAGPSSASS